MQQKIGRRQKFGQWILKKHLGDGGNGHVWKAVNSNGEEVAIKFLTNIDRKPYARFKDEIHVLKQNSDIEGILPILDYYLPDKPDEGFPWYAMPVAQTIEDYLADKDFDGIIHAIGQIAQTTNKLHERNISHRDIKPANLLVRDGKFYLADFGLVDHPDKLDLTSTGENIGAKWTMAPEMRRNGHEADGKPADVYSLAKTLWILLTKNKMGFDGQYRPDSVNGLINFPITRLSENGIIAYEEKIVFTKPLDDLLEKSTSDSPLERPTSDEFLSQILQLKSSLGSSPLRWDFIQQKLFPIFAPARAIWEQKEDIISILNLIGKYGINHMLYPDGGGLDLSEAIIGKEPDTIELIMENMKVKVELVKPKRLILERFADNSEWNYFLLEADELEPSDVGHIYKKHEEIVEIESLHYIKRNHWEENSYLEEPLPSSARLVRRFLNGSFLIIQKTAIYNRIDMYDGLHNRMTTDDFRDYVFEKSQIYQQIIANEDVKKKALEINITPRDWAIGYLRQEARKEWKKYHTQVADLFSDLED